MAAARRKLVLIAVIVCALFSYGAISQLRENHQETDDSNLVRGFYSPYTRHFEYDGMSLGTSTCDSFVIIDGNGATVDSLRKTVTGGNTVNRIDESGRLVINISFNETDPVLSNKIKTSSESRPINVNLSIKEGSGKDASPCQSIVKLSE